MFDTPEVMRLAQSLARHAGARQALVSRNIANADTPGYRAKGMTEFTEVFRQSSTAIKSSRPAHMVRRDLQSDWKLVDVGSQAAPNGNTVSLEAQMVRGAKAKSDHDMALMIYSNSMDVLRTALGRGR